MPGSTDPVSCMQSDNYNCPAPRELAAAMHAKYRRGNRQALRAGLISAGLTGQGDALGDCPYRHRPGYDVNARDRVRCESVSARQRATGVAADLSLTRLGGA